MTVNGEVHIFHSVMTLCESIIVEKYLESFLITHAYTSLRVIFCESYLYRATMTSPSLIAYRINHKTRVLRSTKRVEIRKVDDVFTEASRTTSVTQRVLLLETKSWVFFF